MNYRSYRAAFAFLLINATASLSLAQESGTDKRVSDFREEGINHYQTQQFDKAVQSFKQALGINPNVCLLVRFPHALIYGIDQETIVVIAVAHLHRQPRYWADRIE